MDAEKKKLLDEWFNRQDGLRKKELVKMALKRSFDKIMADVAKTADEAANLGELSFYEILQEEQAKEVK